LHRFNAGSRWWAAFNEDSVIREFSDLSRKRVLSDSSHRRSLHVLLIPQDSVENSKAMVDFDWGLPIAYPDVNFIFKDLSYADSLYFSAKGSGTLGVQMICRAEDLLQNAVFEMDIHLDSLWQDFAIGMDEFRIVAGDSLDASHSWDEVKTHCKATAFYAKGPVDLWLDDIAIGGVRLRDIE